MTFITSDPTAPYRHALNAWVSPLATCALPKGVCYLLTYYLYYLRVTSEDRASKGARRAAVRGKGNAGAPPRTLRE